MDRLVFDRHRLQVAGVFALVVGTLAAVPTCQHTAAQQPGGAQPSAVAQPAADLDDTTPTLPPGTDEPPSDPAWRKTMGPPRGVKKLFPDHEIWIHPQRKVVVVDGVVVFREGPLEMFACPRGTKEHESVVSLFAKAFQVHAALLAVGAQPGRPVRFAPEYQPAEGTTVEIRILWLDQAGRRHIDRAQDWVRELRTGRPLPYPWVFAGSGFWEDQQGIRHYQAEAGDLICVSNFATATLDLPIESSQATGQLAFEAFTEHIPPLGTHVRLVLQPKLDTQPTDPPPHGDTKSDVAPQIKRSADGKP